MYVISKTLMLQFHEIFTGNAILSKRCEVSDLRLCLKNPNHHPCCNQINADRFFPIGPFVEPSLLENWMSALFEFAGKNPVTFTAIKTAVFFTTAAILTVLWGFLGTLQFPING